LAASKTLRVAKYGDADCLGAHIGIRAFEFASGMDMSEEDMDATLGIATITKSGTPAGYLIGDGAIVLGYKDSIHVVVAEWSGNMPGYPSYAEGADSRYKSFCAQSDDYAVSEGRSAFTVSYYRLGSEKPYSVMRCDAAEGLNGWVVNGYQDATFLAVFTDGVGQVSGLSLHEVVRELTDFPVARGGAFVRRQINSALNGWAKKGHYPQDDISMACLIRLPDDV
jgi:hypothetical protein